MIESRVFLLFSLLICHAKFFIHVNCIETITKFEDESSSSTWNKRAQQTLKDHLEHSDSQIPDRAMSGILAMGSGMSLDTLTAARFMHGIDVQQETPLFFESFPVTSLVNTYCVDSQVGDAACTATAYLSGMRSNAGMIGSAPVGGAFRCGIHDDTDKLRLGSIAEWALDAGKSVGIISTSSITHPGVAGTYGRSTKASWQDDNNVISDGFDPDECPDLAIQLLQSDPGNKFKVILGGGRQHFLPNTTKGGKRSDSANLISNWVNERINLKQKHKYVGNKKDLQAVDHSVDYLLGLFTSDNLQYHMLAPPEQPTLEDMTEAAIKVLSKNPNGFFLYIFGGRIGDAHGENKAVLAADETIELSKAIKKANSMTDKDETLIVVSANYGHTMKISGYTERWKNFFELVNNKDKEDEYQYSQISYANGPGYRLFEDGHRPLIQNSTGFKEHSPSFQFLATVPLSTGTGGGEDVALFARGPSEYLFNGVIDQHLIPHIMAYSLCIGQGTTACGDEYRGFVQRDQEYNSSSQTSKQTIISLLSLSLIYTVSRILY